MQLANLQILINPGAAYQQRYRVKQDGEALDISGWIFSFQGRPVPDEESNAALDEPAAVTFTVTIPTQTGEDLGAFVASLTAEQSAALLATQGQDMLLATDIQVDRGDGLAVPFAAGYIRFYPRRSNLPT